MPARKVHIVLEELGVPIDWRPFTSFDEMKLEPYVSLNPNGRVPAIEDPNTGLKLWEVSLYLANMTKG